MKKRRLRKKVRMNVPPNYNKEFAETMKKLAEMMYGMGAGKWASSDDLNQRPYSYKDPNPPDPPGTIDLTFEEITDS